VLRKKQRSATSAAARPRKKISQTEPDLVKRIEAHRDEERKRMLEQQVEERKEKREKDRDRGYER
jgi:hypothetical protein